jgi:DNA-binding NtrC family response regulator
MAESVFLSTHHLPLAGALRDALRQEGLRVHLVPTPELAREAMEADGPGLLILTGEAQAEGWGGLAREMKRDGWPVFAVLPDPGTGSRTTIPGVRPIFFADRSEPGEIARVARRAAELRRVQRLTGIVGTSAPILDVLAQVAQMAPVDSTVLVTGESGTGKELVARGLHVLSPRRSKPFLAINVAALSETLLESELFGHEKGAFTGAVDARKGFFELAQGGTLFLDEIGEMPLSTQTKFLRVLEQREFLRVGGQRAIEVDVRIVAATNRDLRDAVAQGTFRRDLFYRLSILNLRLPPLRERAEDIPELVARFVDEVVDRTGRAFPGITPEAMARLQAHPWPGNIRELRNLVESMVVMSPGREITPTDLPRELSYPLLPGPRVALPAPGQPTAPSSDPASPPPAALAQGTEGPALRPELEFIFRTLVDLRVDMEELRREFERYRSEVAPSTPQRRPIPERDDGWELGIRSQDTEAFVVPEEPDAIPQWVAQDSGHSIQEPAPELQIPEDMTMDAIEEVAIRAALTRAKGNRRLAAERLGIGERTLYRKIQKYGLD